jgi:glycosyltransferase involved in cell wall biosynthesis
MNLLFTLTSYPPSIGGAQLLQHHTALRLAARHLIQVVTHWDANRTDWLLGTTLRAPTQPRDYAIDGIPVHRLGLSVKEKVSLLPSLALYYPLMELALRPICSILEGRLAPYASGADLIHNVRIGREGLSLASLHAARARGIPFVLTPVHHPRWKGWLYRVYLNLYREADALIALTEAEKRILVGLGVDEERIHVTGFGPILAQHAQPDTFISRCGVDGPLVLFLGQHYAYKGYRQVLQAAPLVWAKFPQAKFAFIGRAVGHSEEDFEAHKDSRIVRLGEVSLQEKTDALAACSLLCVPSTQESFGGVYTEAWSYGKPVIGCNIPAVSEVITEGQDGILVPQEPMAIAGAICQLLASPLSANAMGEAGRRKVEERYSWERLAALTEQAYGSVLARPMQALRMKSRVSGRT